MRLEDFDYELPRELIAQTPSLKRDECRLMVLDRAKNTIEHRHFYDILEYLHEGDCLVVNDSRVIPARLYGIKEKTGAHIELLLIKRLEGDKWESLVKPGKRLKEGDTVVLDENKLFKANILGFKDKENGTRIIEFEYEGIFMERLEEIGSMPLPPYIERDAGNDDKERYQTVYSKVDGSVAAPTAGLHFTEELLEKVREKGVEIAYVTLHVEQLERAEGLYPLVRPRRELLRVLQSGLTVCGRLRADIVAQGYSFIRDTSIRLWMRLLQISICLNRH